VALKLGELVAYLKTDNTGLRRGLAEGRQEVRRGGRDMETEAAATAVAMAAVLGAGGGRGGEQFTRDATGRLRNSRGQFVRAGQEAGEALGEGVYRGADGRLRDARGRFVRVGRELGEAAGGGARGGMDSLRRAADNLAMGVTNVATSIPNLTLALVVLGATAMFLVPVVSLLGGALASLPALAAGAGAGVATLAIGFGGLADAFKETASAGGAAVDKTWQVHQAVRALAWAQREVKDAQEALTRARADEVERLSDLNRELREARLSEEEAALNVRDAEQRLAEAKNAVAIAEDKLARARRSGDIGAIRRATEELLEAQRQQPDEIRRAELAYERAKLAVESAQDRTEDLTKEQQRAARVGVEGSDQVRAALDRQKRAVEALEDAHHALAEARKPAGGGGGVAQELTKLAPAAQQAVDAIKSLAPAWESLRLGVQQRLFAGVGREIKLLASAWLPVLHERLGGMADMFNGLFKNFSRSVRKPQFIADVSVGLEAVERMIGRIGTAITGPFMDAFGRLSRAAEPFIDALGEYVGGFFDKFSAWIKSADQSGKLQEFMARATEFLKEFFRLGRDVASIFGSIMTILFDAPEVSTSPWVGLRQSLESIAKWFKDPENQEKVREWIDRIKDFGVWIFTEGIPTVTRWVERVDGWVKKAEEWGGRIIRFKDAVVDGFDRVVTFLDKLPGRISRVASGMWNGLWTSFRSTLNRIIEAWNNLSFTVGGGSVLGVNVPSLTLNTPNIPYLARGGHIMRAGAAWVGEEGPELLELPAGATVRPLSGGGAAAGGGIHGELRITGELRARGSDLVLVLRNRAQITQGGIVKLVDG
jgi:flavodoxin